MLSLSASSAFKVLEKVRWEGKARKPIFKIRETPWKWEQLPQGENEIFKHNVDNILTFEAYFCEFWRLAALFSDSAHDKLISEGWIKIYI